MMPQSQRYKAQKNAVNFDRTFVFSSRYYLPITSKPPIYGRNTSGTVIEPSAF